MLGKENHHPAPHRNRSSSFEHNVPSEGKNNVTDSKDSIRELKRIKVSLTEKDRQLVILEQQLSIANSRISTLTADSVKSKRSEKVSKRLLLAKESSVRRQSVALKFASFQLEQFARKDENKLRRSRLEKKELEEELEKIGNYYYYCFARTNV